MGIVDDDDDASETINDIVTLQERKLRIDGSRSIILPYTVHN